MAPGLPAISVRYNITSPTVTALTLSIYLLAFAIGPFFVGPFSEMYGRVWVLHLSNIVFTIFNLASIFAPDTPALIVFRFFGAWVVVDFMGCLYTPIAFSRPRGMYTRIDWWWNRE